MKDIDKILEDIITPRFLRLVEKWARYKGKQFSVGDIDVTIINKGTFRTTFMMKDFEMIPKAEGEGFDLVFDDFESPHYTDYDVTVIRNNCVCSDYNIRVLIAEILPEDYNRMPKLFIYSIKEGKGTKIHPSFATLKKDFEAGTYQYSYQSMLYNFCDIYKLSPFNHETDRIFNFTGIEGDLECIECEVEEDKLSNGSGIITCDWEKQYVEHIAYLRKK